MKKCPNQTLGYGIRRTPIVLGLSAALCMPAVFSYASVDHSASSELVQSVLQSRTVKGKIVDETGEPMIGVSVIVKGQSTVGTITDFDGNYVLEVPAATGILEVSYIGYKTQEVTVGKSDVLNIQMQPDTQALDEVVVVGYGTQKKRDLTGAISSVKSDDIKLAPVANVMEALQGKVSGLDITRTSGQSGKEPEVLLRGNRSLEASSAPLYIIDGIAGSINNLNPNDIESIEVLKDASSTAIYGSAGANGVIIVTTKQASEGKLSVDFDAYVGVNTSPSYPSALQGQDWLNYLEAGFYNANGRKANDRNELLSAWSLEPNVLSPYLDNGKWIDWVDKTLQTGIQQNYNLSLRGGTEKIQAYFSLGYNSEQGVYKNDKADTYTMRAGGNFQIKPWLKAGIQSYMYFKDKDSRTSRINKTFGTVPLGDVYDENGNINTYPIEGMSTVSLLADDVPGVFANNSKSFGIHANPYVEITPLKGLTFKSVLGVSLSTSRNGKYQSENTYSNLTGSGNPKKAASYDTSLGYNYTWQNLLNYNFKIANDHDITLTGITEWAYTQSEKSSNSNEGFDYDDFLWFNMGAGNNPLTTSNYTMKKKMSYAIRVNYNYLGRYLLTVSNRWDGASQLYDKWDSFPAVALGWRISDEPFMEQTRDWLSNMKLRIGYGVTGNSNIDAYVTQTQVASSENKLQLGGGQVPSYMLTQAIGNKFLTWEKSYNTNVGLDLSFFNNRIDMSIEWYNTDSKGVLYKRPLPSAFGVFTAKKAYQMMSNIAKINNKGIELTLNTHNINTKSFQWNSTLTFAKNNEKVKNIELGSNTTVDELVSLNLFLGHPVNTVYGYKKIGIWQLGEEEEAAKYGCKPGEVKLATVEQFDENGVGDKGVHKYSEKDKQILGAKTPDWTLGFKNSFYYKNFDLSVFMNMRWGQMCSADLLGYFNYGVNIPSNYNYWTPENPTNDFPQPSLKTPENSYAATSVNLVDASFIKIKNITLGYTLPQKLAIKAGLSRLRVYSTISNPFIWAKSHLLKDMDPETGGSDSFPLYKTVVFGVNVSF